MAERLISVPAARSHIDATVADPILKACMHNVLDAIPAVDAVEVVRCGDCTHFERNKYTDCGGYCNQFGYYDYAPRVSEGDFCSFGEKRCDNG